MFLVKVKKGVDLRRLSQFWFLIKIELGESLILIEKRSQK